MFEKFISDLEKLMILKPIFCLLIRTIILKIVFKWLYICKLNTPQKNVVKRSKYLKGFDFKRKIIKYCGSNCYIPTK